MLLKGRQNCSNYLNLPCACYSWFLRADMLYMYGLQFQLTVKILQWWNGVGKTIRPSLSSVEYARGESIMTEAGICQEIIYKINNVVSLFF